MLVCFRPTIEVIDILYTFTVLANSAVSILPFSECAGPALEHLRILVQLMFECKPPKLCTHNIPRVFAEIPPKIKSDSIILEDALKVECF